MQEFYHVTISVISQQITGRKTSLDTTGRDRKTALSAELVSKIVESLIARAKTGYPCDKEELLDLIQEYVRAHNVKTPFVEDRLGEDWYYLFLQRHGNVIIKKTRTFTKM